MQNAVGLHPAPTKIRSPRLLIQTRRIRIFVHAHGNLPPAPVNAITDGRDVPPKGLSKECFMQKPLGVAACPESHWQSKVLRPGRSPDVHDFHGPQSWTHSHTAGCTVIGATTDSSTDVANATKPTYPSPEAFRCTCEEAICSAYARLCGSKTYPEYVAVSGGTKPNCRRM
ncbi:hypothetical protein M011DRAFT_93972 [Sporormia fimetaria CBS 119925]|uniref:Uncharacterized protein n=1 Tax=Sporormia fimetaria CBS 119925 TaxID=1340428 RepID=A0A6A6V9H6_9PLEO|nr:hypothetical protein M011DRAFT_93972 [Sporormia fimetaria CBS 119925]